MFSRYHCRAVGVVEIVVEQRGGKESRVKDVRTRTGSEDIESNADRKEGLTVHEDVHNAVSIAAVISYGMVHLLHTH
jgi:hypothetical protein